MIDFAAAMKALDDAPGIYADELPGLAEGIMKLTEAVSETEPDFGAPPRCWPCSLTYAEGRDRNAPAAYWWIFDDGLRTPLCVSCCAGWRENLAREPEVFYPPARIVQVRT